MQYAVARFSSTSSSIRQNCRGCKITSASNQVHTFVPGPKACSTTTFRAPDVEQQKVPASSSAILDFIDIFYHRAGGIRKSTRRFDRLVLFVHVVTHDPCVQTRNQHEPAILSSRQRCSPVYVKGLQHSSQRFSLPLPSGRGLWEAEKTV